MPTVTAHRVLPEVPFAALADYEAAGGGEGLRSARLVEPEVVIGELEASGLRGRGGAGFPTGRKWRTVLEYGSELLDTVVVVNAAEGEPGTYKDRSILLANPYAVIEGALIAAWAVGSRNVVIATKQRFTDVVLRLETAVAEIERAGWSEGITMTVVGGPEEYLYGEETALLEVMDGRAPLPRVTPPWRRGVVEVVEDAGDLDGGSNTSSAVVMATPDGDNVVPPVLVDNVETMANVPAIIAFGAAEFRAFGTDESPGTIVCTVTGAVRRATVVEVPMGTTLRTVLEVAGGMREDETTGAARSLRCVLMGVSNAVLGPEDLDTPLSYEAMASRGTGLGSASFIVVDDTTHPVAVAAAASRFLAVESCGQCMPCKGDGLRISGALADMVSGVATPEDLVDLTDRLDTITTGARCALATQHQVVIGSILRRFPEEFSVRSALAGDAIEPYQVAELDSIVDGYATLDEAFRTKQPDWTHDEIDSGQLPAERLGEHRAG
jgi:NADH-quinone oxidoreductase subunit F